MGGVVAQLEWDAVTTTDPIELRIAEPGDAAELHRIIHQSFAARAPVDPPADALSDTVADIEARLEGAPGVLALIDDVPVGCLLLSRHDDVVRLHRVSVLPSAQNVGVAAVMVRGAAHLASDLGARRIELVARREFPALVRWWQRYGFEIAGEVRQGFLMGRSAPVRFDVPTAHDMVAFGRRLAGVLRAGDVLVANGDLGAGKTTLAQGTGVGLGVTGPVISPTFVLSRVHHNPGDGPDLVHVDAYRLNSAQELTDLDLDASLADSVTLIEWGTGLVEKLAVSRLEIDIQRDADPGEHARVVYVAGIGPRWAAVDLALLGERVAP